jgi:hypothetical protein
MSRQGKPRPPVNLADPAAVGAWADAVRSKLYEIHTLTTEGTKRKELRKLSRGYIRHRVMRFISDINVSLEVLTGKPEVVTIADLNAALEKPEGGTVTLGLATVDHAVSALHTVGEAITRSIAILNDGAPDQRSGLRVIGALREADAANLRALEALDVVADGARTR